MSDGTVLLVALLAGIGGGMLAVTGFLAAVVLHDTKRAMRRRKR